jgi:hypothetical protein
MGNAVKQIEITIEDCKVVVERGKALQRLLENPDFNSIIMKGYMEREAHRLTLMLADPACETVQGRENIVRDLSAIAQLNAHFRTIRTAGDVAQRTLAEHQEELEFQLRQELAGE